MDRPYDTKSLPAKAPSPVVVLLDQTMIWTTLHTLQALREFDIAIREEVGIDNDNSKSLNSKV